MLTRLRFGAAKWLIGTRQKAASHSEFKIIIVATLLLFGLSPTKIVTIGFLAHDELLFCLSP